MFQTASARIARPLLLGGLVLAATLVAVLALGGRGNALAGGPGATPSPSAQPSPTTVRLDTADGQDVIVDIDDETGSITGARSGRPAEGISVEPYTLEVENVDADTLRLSWSDFAMDNHDTLYAFENDGQLVLVLVQPEPQGPVDAIGADRILEIDLDHAVDASEVRAHLQDGLDTPGE